MKISIEISRRRRRSFEAADKGRRGRSFRNVRSTGVNSELAGALVTLRDRSCEANRLNAVGITTMVNMYGNGIVEWGNYTTAFPGTTTPDAFECVRRSRMIMKRSLDLACAQFIDVKHVRQADIDLVRNTVNQYYNRLVAEGKIVYGQCFFRPENNPASELVLGHVTFTCEFTPAIPMQCLTFEHQIDLTQLTKSHNAMKVNKVYDANIFVNNTSTHGQASEVTPPTLTAVMADYKAMGMAGSLELFNGFDKMETTIKWTYPDSDTQKVFANFRKPVDLMIRSSKAECETGEMVEVPIVMYVKGYSKTHPAGTFKAKEDTELESSLAVNYYRLEIDGDPIVEVDVLNNIYKVGGEDLLAERRQNLGI